MRIFVVFWLSILINLVRACVSVQDAETRNNSEEYLTLSAEALAKLPPVRKTFNAPNVLGDDFTAIMEDDQLATSSFLSASYLEELGLRSSRSSTPSIISSPSQNLRKISSSGTFSYILANQKTAVDISSDSDNGLDDIEVPENDYYIEYSENDDITDDIDDEQALKVENNVHEVTTSNNIPGDVINSSASTTVDNSRFRSIPDAILPMIIEYCGDSTLLQVRRVNKRFRDSCDVYLNLLTGLTLKPQQSSENELNFHLQFSLASTMLPFYRNQPQISHILTQLLQKPWRTSSLIDLATSSIFKSLSIFSDEFITEILIPTLRNFPQIDSQDPLPLFLLGEALLKIKRVDLFHSALLPVLNEVSFVLADGISTPNEILVSPGFMHLQEGQEILGATLHSAIDFNLTLIVKHFVNIYPMGISLKNHCGRTALLKIVENIQNWYTNLPGPDANTDINEWIDGIVRDFIHDRMIQKEFPGNSLILNELFFEIINQISGISASTEEAIQLLGFNQVYDLFNLTQGVFRKHRTSLLRELVSYRQYDILLSIGLHFGPLIQNNLENNNLLHTAAEINNSVITAVLLRFFPNLDVNQLTHSGLTAVGVATNRNSVGPLRILLNDLRVNPNLHDYTDPLLHSIELGYMESMALLIAHPSIQIHNQIIKNHKARSSIERAVARKNWRAVGMLLSCTNQRYDQDLAALPHLQTAEKNLAKCGDKYSELLQMIREIILPTIQEQLNE